jgi:hypothetical protein
VTLLFFHAPILRWRAGEVLESWGHVSGGGLGHTFDVRALREDRLGDPVSHFYGRSQPERSVLPLCAWAYRSPGWPWRSARYSLGVRAQGTSVRQLLAFYLSRDYLVTRCAAAGPDCHLTRSGSNPGVPSLGFAVPLRLWLTGHSACAELGRTSLSTPAGRYAGTAPFFLGCFHRCSWSGMRWASPGPSSRVSSLTHCVCQYASNVRFVLLIEHQH